MIRSRKTWVLSLLLEECIFLTDIFKNKQRKVRNADQSWPENTEISLCAEHKATKPQASVALLLESRELFEKYNCF